MGGFRVLLLREIFLISFDIETYRKKKSDWFWDLPAWGHPISQGIMPLFLDYQDRLTPIGTAFLISRKVFFIGTALHNIEEAVKLETGGDLRKYLTQREGGQFELKNVGLSVFHQRKEGPKKLN